MPPSLATLLTLGFIIVLLVRDQRTQAKVSAALWLPVIWLTLNGSRFVSQWLSLFGVGGPSGDMADGSPIDAACFLALILAGMTVLVRRRIVIAEIVSRNRWLTFFLIYTLISIVWSDFPLIAAKRWIKTLGHPVMALVIITDADPISALRTVLKRCAYFLLPGSVLFIKYYPQYGRGFDAFSGQAYNQGVGLTKNDLGYTCMVLGLFFFWNLLTMWKSPDRVRMRGEIILSIGFLIMIAWLLKLADSATSLTLLTGGSVALVAMGFRFINRKHIGVYIVVFIAVAAIANQLFDLYDNIILMLNRDPTLTDRTKIWTDVLALQTKPLLGFGFETFWLGPRLDVMWAKWWWHPNQSHNGYIETYLNLGLVGVSILVGLILSTFISICRQLSVDFDLSRLRLVLLFCILIFNYTEAAFKATHFVWTIFYIIALDYPKRRMKSIPPTRSLPSHPAVDPPRGRTPPKLADGIERDQRVDGRRSSQTSPTSGRATGHGQPRLPSREVR